MRRPRAQMSVPAVLAIVSVLTTGGAPQLRAELPLYDEPDLSVSGIPVRPDGMISFPLIGDAQAAGRTVDELTASISERLCRFVNEPRVSVIV